jgi:hypothetical protein
MKSSIIGVELDWMLDFFKAKKMICVDLLLFLNLPLEIPAKNLVILMKKDQYRLILLDLHEM